MSALAHSPRITPFLWFDSNAEEAVDYYVSIFKNSRKLNEHTSSADTPSGPKGMVLTISFELDGQRFTALNGGPLFKFTEAVSLQVCCDDQLEIDFYWDALSAGGDPKAQQCGWLKDRYGLSWQITWDWARYFTDPDSEKSARAMRAILQMKKPDLAAIDRAVAGR